MWERVGETKDYNKPLALCILDNQVYTHSQYVILTAFTLGSFVLEAEEIKSIGLGAIWNFSNVTGLL